MNHLRRKATDDDDQFSVATVEDIEDVQSFLSKSKRRRKEPEHKRDEEYETKTMRAALERYINTCAKMHDVDSHSFNFFFLVGYLEHVVRSLQPILPKGAIMHLGEAAASLISFPVAAAYQLMSMTSPSHLSLVEQITHVAVKLDQALYLHDKSITLRGDQRVSAWAFRCAVPFVFGFTHVLPERQVKIVGKLVRANNEKELQTAVAYIYNHIVYRDEDDDRDPSPTLRPFVTNAQLHEALQHISPDMIADMFQLAKLHIPSGEGYEVAEKSDPKRCVERNEPFFIPPTGSIVRAYIRGSGQGTSYPDDDQEPDVHSMEDVVPSK